MSDEAHSVRLPLKVMIVDDHLIYRLGLGAVLESDVSITIVAEADNGQQALMLAQKLKPDVILMDVSMPILNGIEATRQIKVLVPQCKVLMLTSHSGDTQLFAALSAGADGYCLKDTCPDMLRMAVRAIGDGVGWLDPGIAKRVMLACTGDGGHETAVARFDESLTESEKFGLSNRQLAILELLVRGMTNLQMAEELALSPDTIKTHMRNIMDKLAVADRTQAAVKAIREGLVK